MDGALPQPDGQPKAAHTNVAGVARAVYGTTSVVQIKRG